MDGLTSTKYRCTLASTDSEVSISLPPTRESSALRISEYWSSTSVASLVESKDVSLGTTELGLPSVVCDNQSSRAGSWPSADATIP